MANTDEKIFLAEIELAALNTIQSETGATQEKSWAMNQDKLAFYEQNF